MHDARIFISIYSFGLARQSINLTWGYFSSLKQQPQGEGIQIKTANGAEERVLLSTSPKLPMNRFLFAPQVSKIGFGYDCTLVLLRS